MNDCIWCGSLSHRYEDCPDRAEVADRNREYADLRAVLAAALTSDAPSPPTCTRWVSSAHDDEDTNECGRPATVEAFTTSGQWEPHCATHVAGWPFDRIRQAAEVTE